MGSFMTGIFGNTLLVYIVLKMDADSENLLCVLEIKYVWIKCDSQRTFINIYSSLISTWKY